MTVSEEKLREIRTRISQTQSKKARAEVELETSQERRQRALSALKDDFGIKGAEDIARVQEELQKELDDAVVDVTSALEKAQG